MRRHSSPSVIRLRAAADWGRRHKLWFATAALLGLAGWQGFLQDREERRLRETAEAVVARAGAATPREKAVALRDHVRASVSFAGGAPRRPPVLAGHRVRDAGQR